MAIQRWDPLKDLLQLQQSMNRMFEEALARSSSVVGAATAGAAWKPPTDLFEESDRYVLRADLPGVVASDVEVRIEEGQLILHGKRNADERVDRESYLRVERPRGPFTLQVSLPPSVDTRRIEARHRNGVLEVVLPKRKDNGSGRVEVAGE